MKKRLRKKQVKKWIKLAMQESSKSENWLLSDFYKDIALALKEKIKNDDY